MKQHFKPFMIIILSICLGCLLSLDGFEKQSGQQNEQSASSSTMLGEIPILNPLYILK
jgi:hypothetical protein